VDSPEQKRAVKGIRLSDAMLVVAGTGAVIAAISRGPEPLGMLQIWAIHATIGALLSAPIVVLGRRRVHWESADLLAFLLPFAAWDALTNYSAVGKSLGNLAEPLLLSLTLPVAALIRGASSIGTENWNRIVLRRVIPGLRGRNRPVSTQFPPELCV